MRRVFRILSSKLDHKLNHPRMARTILRSKVNIYGTIIGRVYGEYTITSFLGNFGACANIRYQAAFPPPRPGYEASKSHTALELTCRTHTKSLNIRHNCLVLADMYL